MYNFNPIQSTTMTQKMQTTVSSIYSPSLCHERCWRVPIPSQHVYSIFNYLTKSAYFVNLLFYLIITITI